jgi:hypothetical protein
MYVICVYQIPNSRLTISTGTGVAFCNISTGEETVRWLQKWPGRANAVENKVKAFV